MLGGTILLGVSTGVLQIYNTGKYQIPVDTLNLISVAKNLPILLAVGSIHRQLKQRTIQKWIRIFIHEAKINYERRKIEVESEFIDEKDKEGKNRFTVVEQTLATVTRANDMAENFNWTSAYDVYKKIRKVASL